MKKIHLRASWIVDAQREAMYKVVSDFENMPKYFPKVAHSIEIVERDGTTS